MKRIAKLKPGTQIAYIPLHANDDINHPDVEYGFVTSIRGNIAFCRYWHKKPAGVLRTTANSEATPIDNLRVCKLYPQTEIDILVAELSGARIK